MLGPRCSIYSRNPTVARPWITPLRSVGATVTLVEKPEALGNDTDIFVARVDAMDDPILAHLDQMPAKCSGVLVVPDLDVSMGAAVLARPQIQAVIVESSLNNATIAYIAAKLTWGHIIGARKLLPWGVIVATDEIQQHEGRSRAMAGLRSYLSALGLRATQRDAVESVADELLMNAMYDAPVDRTGKHVFADVPPGQRGSITLERPVILQYGSDGSRLVLGVRDNYGSLRREAVLKRMEECAKLANPIESKPSGAGLGLYMVASRVTELIFNVVPGSVSEVIAVLETQGSRPTLRHLGFYGEPNRDLSDAASSSRSKKPTIRAPAKSHHGTGSTIITAVATLTVMLACAVVFWPKLRPAPPAGVTIETSPAGASVYVEGVLRGTANPQLELDDLAPSSPHRVTAKMQGYDDASELVKAEAERPTTITLGLKPTHAEIQVESRPAGATIHVDGRDTGKRTPAVIEDAVAGRPHEVGLTLEGYAPVSTSVNIPKGSRIAAVTAALAIAPDYAALTLRSDPSGARLWINDSPTDLVTPFSSHVLPAGKRYHLRLVAPNRRAWTFSWVPRSGEQLVETATLPEGLAPQPQNQE